MDEERLRIQKMVADGKITPEEGDELIESLGRQDSEGAATVESGPGQVSPRKRSGRNVAGIISLCLFLGGLALLVACALITVGSNVFLGVFPPGALEIAIFALPALLLEILAAVIGFIGWRSTSGKIGAIGGLVTTFLMLPLAAILLWWCG